MRNIRTTRKSVRSRMISLKGELISKKEIYRTDNEEDNYNVSWGILDDIKSMTAELKEFKRYKLSVDIEKEITSYQDLVNFLNIVRDDINLSMEEGFGRNKR